MTLDYTGLRSTSMLVGRDAELASIERFVDDVPGAGSALLLTGEPGVGKTRLLEAAEDLARGASLRVLTSEGFRTETAIPFAALHKLLLPLLGGLPDLAGAHRRGLEIALGFEAGPQPEPLVVFNAALSFLSAAARERPIILIVDNLQSIDDSSAAVLSFVSHRLEGTSIGLLCASRRAEGCPIATATQLHLSRLAPADSALLLASQAPTLPAQIRGALLHQADGNPLALLELLREAQATGNRGLGMLNAIVPADRLARFPFLRSVESLPARTTSALLLLALDRRGDVGALAHADLAIDDLAPAERTGVIRVDMETLTARFDHPLLRSTVVARASSGERRVAHLSLAARAGMGIEERAFHLAEATTDVDESTASLLEGAAHEALTRGDSSAATHALTRAARLSPEPRDRRRRFARAAYVAVDISEEGQLDPELVGEVQRVVGRPAPLYAVVADAFARMENGGGSSVACTVIRDAVVAGDHRWDASNKELIDALSSWLVLCWTSGRPEHWTSYFDALERLVPAPPDPLKTLSLALADTVRAGAGLRRDVSRILSSVDGVSESNDVLIAGTAAIFFDQLHVVRPMVSRLVESGRGAPSTHSYYRSLALLALDDIGAGRWREAQALIDEALATDTSSSEVRRLGLFYYLAALLAAARGDLRECETWAIRLEEQASRLDSLGLRRFGHHARVLCASGQADWERVYNQASALSAAGSFPPFVPQAIWVAYDLVESAVRTGRTVEAQAHCAAMVEADLPALSPRFEMLTHAAGALIAEGDEWRDRYERALSVPGAEDWPLDFARVRLAFGARLRRERHPSEARDQLHLALTIFERLSARPWIATTRNELRAAREHVDAREGSAALTAQELAVAELAAGGFSNKQIGQRLFLSSRTVSGHLYRVFPKLGIVSRSALRDALVGQGRPQ